MGKFFGDLVSKLLWVVVGCILAGAGYVWALNTILRPPQGAAPPAISASPTPAALPANASAPLPAISPAAAPSPAATSPLTSPVGNSSSLGTASPDPNQSPILPAASPIPAIAQADDVVLEAPKKLEKGAKLKIFLNNTDASNPDPLLSSPSRQVDVPGLTLVRVDRNEFEEVSGYFLVPETGTYNFAVDLPKNFPTNSSKTIVMTRIDGTALPNSQGGRLDLEKGWHEIRVFFNGETYYVDPNEIKVSWSREGDTLFPMAVWREVQ